MNFGVFILIIQFGQFRHVGFFVSHISKSNFSKLLQLYYPRSDDVNSHGEN